MYLGLIRGYMAQLIVNTIKIFSLVLLASVFDVAVADSTEVNTKLSNSKNTCKLSLEGLSKRMISVKYTNGRMAVGLLMSPNGTVILNTYGVFKEETEDDRKKLKVDTLKGYFLNGKRIKDATPITVEQSHKSNFDITPSSIQGFESGFQLITVPRVYLEHVFGNDLEPIEQEYSVNYIDGQSLCITGFKNNVDGEQLTTFVAVSGDFRYEPSDYYLGSTHVVRLFNKIDNLQKAVYFGKMDSSIIGSPVFKNEKLIGFISRRAKRSNRNNKPVNIDVDYSSTNDIDSWPGFLPLSDLNRSMSAHLRDLYSHSRLNLIETNVNSIATNVSSIIDDVAEIKQRFEKCDEDSFSYSVQFQNSDPSNKLRELMNGKKTKFTSYRFNLDNKTNEVVLMDKSNTSKIISDTIRQDSDNRILYCFKKNNINDMLENLRDRGECLNKNNRIVDFSLNFAIYNPDVEEPFSKAIKYTTNKIDAPSNAKYDAILDDAFLGELYKQFGCEK